MKYIVINDDGNQCGLGATLEDAFAAYKDTYDDENPEDLLVYEAEPIDVEFKIVKKVKPVKILNKPEGK